MKTFLTGLSVIFILLLTIIGCSEDTPITIAPPVVPIADTITLFTKDSIYASYPNRLIDSCIYFCSVNVDTLIIDFNFRAYRVAGNYSFRNPFKYYPITFDNRYTPIDTFIQLKAFPLFNNYENKFLLKNISFMYNGYVQLYNIRLWYIKRN